MDIINSFRNEIVSFIIGMIFSAIIFLAKKFVTYIVQLYHVLKLRRSQFIFDDNLNIYTIENAVPEYKNITIEASTKKLFVNIPDYYRKIISSDVSFHENTSFDGSGSFRDLSIQTGIYDLENLIEIHRGRVAQYFINMDNGCKFNEIKYGVLNVNIGTRVGSREDPVVTITTFETDFYTYRVFNSIYQELILRNHDISRISSLDELEKYNCFVCSIGVNAIIGINSPKYNKEEIILSKRSGNTINYQNMYHISVNEGMCYMDYNPSSGRVSVERCLFRGIEEEMGISENFHLRNKTDVSYWDLFLSRDTFDFGITCYVKLNGIYFDEIQSLIAKDKCFETSRLEKVSAQKDAITEYVSKRVFVPQGLYTLNSYFIRRFGHALQIPHKKIL
ncbi:MAG: hypothetical protein IJT96_08445 [Lachnospiraceae bacterium]|nr:hypothetical protein [Lachnospiraceae bacterium]